MSHARSIRSTNSCHNHLTRTTITNYCACVFEICLSTCVSFLAFLAQTIASWAAAAAPPPEDRRTELLAQVDMCMCVCGAFSPGKWSIDFQTLELNVEFQHIRH